MEVLLHAADADEAAILALVLRRAGLAVSTVRDVKEALQDWPEHPADLMLLTLPHASRVALELVRYVRARVEVPLVLVVAPLDEGLHYALLEAGTDLVAGRPFSARLLMAQIRALLRRAGIPPGGMPRFSPARISRAGLVLDPLTRTARIGERLTQRLTHLEFRLLYTLMLHAGQPLATDTIVERVWGHSNQADRELVRGLVSRLRAKVEAEPANPIYILTVPGVGYTFQSDSPGG